MKLEKRFIHMNPLKLFAKVTIPNIISMVFMSMYMIIVGVLVGNNIGVDALASVNLVIPIFMIITSLSDMIAIGASVKVSKLLGEKNIDKAKQIFSASMFIIFVISVIIELLLIGTIDDIIFGLISDEVLANYTYDFALPIVYALPLILPYFALDNFLRVCSKTRYSMFVNILIAGMNILLAYLFIDVFKLGMTFAGLSITISLLLGSIFSILPYFSKKVALGFTKIKMSLKDFKEIVYNGSSEFFSNISGSLLASVINTVLLTLGGSIAVASYSIVMYIDSILTAVFYGILEGTSPVISYNYGAKNYKRVFEFYKLNLIATAIISVIFMAVIFIFPESFINIFSSNESAEVTAMAMSALILYSISYLFAWFNMATSSFFTAVEKPKQSIVIMLFQAVVFPLMALGILAPLFNIDGVFSAAVAAELATFVLAIVIFIKTHKEIVKGKKEKHLETIKEEEVVDAHRN